MMQNAEYTVRRQTEVAKTLMISLRETGVDDDAELVSDTIEGETGLFEAMDATLDAMDECDIHVIGLSAKIEELTARRDAKKREHERYRALMEQAMLAVELTTIKRPTATLSLTKRAAGVVVTDESAIPSRFFVDPPRPAPKLDKKALAEALKAKEEIPGATLDNGSISLSVRRK